MPDSPTMTRRAFIGLGAAGALVTIAGCDSAADSGHTVTVTAAPTSVPPPPPTATLLGLVFTTRLQVQHLADAAAATDRDTAVLMTQLLADRKAHLEALESEYTRVSGEQAPTPTSNAATDTTAEQSPTDPDEIIGRIRGEAATAQTMFTDALAEASRFQAQLYASIAACVATHRMVLA